MFESNVMKTKTQKEIHMNGRHSHLTVFNTTQYCMDIPSNIRSNIDYVFALRENITVNKKRLFDYFYGLFPNYKEFNKVFMECTSDYGALVIDKTQPTASVENCLFHYKAMGRLPEFKIGRRIYFKLSSKIDEVARKCKDDNKESTIKIIT
jgi:hypothetical protein